MERTKLKLKLQAAKADLTLVAESVFELAAKIDREGDADAEPWALEEMAEDALDWIAADRRLLDRVEEALQAVYDAVAEVD